MFASRKKTVFLPALTVAFLCEKHSDSCKFFECFVNDTVSRFCGGLARLPQLAKRRFAFIAI